jgi:hypothetical protein
LPEVEKNKRLNKIKEIGGELWAVNII